MSELAGKVQVPGFVSRNPALMSLILFVIVTLTVIGSSLFYTPDRCIANLQEQKRLETEQRIQELRQEREERRQRRFEGVFDPDDLRPETEEKDTPSDSNNSGFGNVFDPNSLSGEEESEAPKPSNNSGFGGVFDPNSLKTDE